MRLTPPFHKLAAVTLTGLAVALASSTGCDSNGASEAGTQKADPSAATPTGPTPKGVGGKGAKKTPKPNSEANIKPVD